MNIQQAKDTLLCEGLFVLNEKKNLGIPIEDVFSTVLNILTGDELDTVVNFYLGLERETFLVDPNDPNSQRLYVSDHYHRCQAKLLIPKQIPHFLTFGNINLNAHAHQHSWANYVGFTETFEYCTVCDEKKR